MDEKKERKPETKKTYQKPKLTVHGTLTQLTRGNAQGKESVFWSGGAEEDHSHSPD